MSSFGVKTKFGPNFLDLAKSKLRYGGSSELGHGLGDCKHKFSEVQL